MTLLSYRYHKERCQARVRSDKINLISIIKPKVRLDSWFVNFFCIPLKNHITSYQIDGLLHERRNSIAKALELLLSCINPSKYTCQNIKRFSFNYQESNIQWAKPPHWNNTASLQDLKTEVILPISTKQVSSKTVDVDKVKFSNEIIIITTNPVWENN